MAYFSRFPIVNYNIHDTSSLNYKLVSNIFVRAKMLESIKKESLVYYMYQVVDGDTPESIASKYYESANRHWIILLANDIVDPTYDWPLSYSNFVSYIDSKYGSSQNAKSTIHHYQKVITKTDSVTGTISVSRHQVDYNTYANLASSSFETINLKDGNSVQIVITKESVTNYDYEEEENEKKREIKIIDRQYVSAIEQELVSIVTNV